MCEYAVVDPLTFTNSLADLIGYCVSLFPLFFFKFLVFEAAIYANKDVYIINGFAIS